MKDKRNLHLKMQEQIDCFAGTDYLTELAAVKNEPDLEQAALKWLALSVLHGINANAQKISLEKTEDGNISIVAKYREAHLPSPGKTVADRVLEAMRHIIHVETDKGEMPLSVGVRDSSVDMKIKVKKDEKKEKLVLKFPEK